METYNQISSDSLQDQVNATVRNYFSNLEGEEPVDLYKMVLEEVEIPLFTAIMTYTKNNQSKAARMLGLARGTLRTKLKKYFDDTYISNR
jgi:Fis family transcriptional regulator, factor for inversion stimulation protein